MDNRKEQERAELHKTIWKSATDFVHGGKLSAWDFKEYFLGFLFYRFISENLKNYINEGEQKAGNKDFNYALLSDEQAEYGRKETVTEKGFYILPSELFENIRKNAHNDKDLNITLDKVFKNIENSARGSASEDDLKGLFSNININSNNLGDTVEEKNKLLCRLLDVIGTLNLGDVKDNSIDMFGDAYEYLISMYASTSGKKGGEFFTPQEVAELLAKIVIEDKKEINKVYDPCCGSGGLLLKFAKVLGKENVKQGFYGQEINLTTYNLCRINMFLHDINYNNFSIARGDTLTSPAHWDDEPFDAIVSNPPYSIPWEGKKNPILINDPRFSPAGILAPESKADLAFTMHMLAWLSTKGTAAIVEYPGILHRKGAEEKIRKYLVENNFVDTVIQLPKDLFFGTDIGTCIIVLKKSKKDNSILFIDASEEFIRNDTKNKLTSENINNILDLIKCRNDVEHKAILISNEEIIKRKYNISVGTYLKPKEVVTQIDIEEHCQSIQDIVEKQLSLRKELEDSINDFERSFRELIENHCPKGVMYQELQELTEFKNGKGHEKNIDEDGQYIVVNSKFISTNGETVKKSNSQLCPVYKNEVLLVMSDLPNGRALSRTFIADEDNKYTLNQRIGGLKVIDEKIMNPRFLYYVLNRNSQLLRFDNKVDQTNLRKDDILKISIPVPPLEVQCEIVHILDNFTLLSAELSAELKARQEQKEYYKNELLNFKKINE